MKGLVNIHRKSKQRRQEYCSCLSLNIKRNNTNIPRNFKSFQKRVPLAEQCYLQQVNKTSIERWLFKLKNDLAEIITEYHRFSK